MSNEIPDSARNPVNPNHRLGLRRVGAALAGLTLAASVPFIATRGGDEGVEKAPVAVTETIPTDEALNTIDAQIGELLQASGVLAPGSREVDNNPNIDTYKRIFTHGEGGSITVVVEQVTGKPLDVTFEAISHLNSYRVNAHRGKDGTLDAVSLDSDTAQFGQNTETLTRANGAGSINNSDNTVSASGLEDFRDAFDAADYMLAQDKRFGSETGA